MSFYVYILRCADASYYVGHTDALETRISAHERGEVAGYTRKRRPVRLVFAQEFATRLEALERERQIKGWCRAKKEALIANNWDRLHRLTVASSGKQTATRMRAHTSASAPAGAFVQDSRKSVRPEPVEGPQSPANPERSPAAAGRSRRMSATPQVSRNPFVLRLSPSFVLRLSPSFVLSSSKDRHHQRILSAVPPQRDEAEG